VRGCLFTLLLGAIVVGFVVVVGLPLIAAGIITGGLTAAGLQSDDTRVVVTSNPPTDLLGLHADGVRITATKATFRGTTIGRLDLSLGDVRVLDRTAGSVDGSLEDVTVQVGAEKVTLSGIDILGGGDAITATTTIPNAEAEALIADAVQRETGTRPTSITLTAPDKLAVKAGASISGRLAVTPSGDLVVRADAGTLGTVQATLLKGGDDLPIKLTSVKVTRAGDLRLVGDLAVGLLGRVTEPLTASR
jgi:hypothetical protein